MIIYSQPEDYKQKINKEKWTYPKGFVGHNQI